jgi:hypothetical protein
MADRNALRLAAMLVLTGFLIAIVSQYIHTTIDGGISSIDNHPAEFLVIAASTNWTAVALAQFLATTFITAGLLAISFGLNITGGVAMVVNRLGAVAAVVSVAISGVTYAVAGVALKHAVDAWVQAPQAEQTARFASAETLSWVQWGTTSYQAFMFSLALLLIGAAIVWTGRITRTLGVIMALQGIAYLVVGWEQGSAGLTLSGVLGVAYYLGSVLLFIWMVWLLIVVWRMKPTVLAGSA